MMTELRQSACFSVEEKTYLRMLFIRWAYALEASGQAREKISYVRLPINIASLTASWPRARVAAASLKYLSAQICGLPMTPSTETRVDSMIFRMCLTSHQGS